MEVCCKRNPKFKAKAKTKTKFMPRQRGDLNIIYDVLQAYTSNYMAQVSHFYRYHIERFIHIYT